MKFGKGFPQHRKNILRPDTFHSRLAGVRLPDGFVDFAMRISGVIEPESRGQGAENSLHDRLGFRPHQITASGNYIEDHQLTAGTQGAANLRHQLFQLDDVMKRSVAKYDIKRRLREFDRIQITLLECDRERPLFRLLRPPGQEARH